MSIESELARFMFRFTNAKWKYSSEFTMQHYVHYQRPEREMTPHHFLSSGFHAVLKNVAGFPVYQVERNNVTHSTSSNRLCILFLHGGSYVNPIKGLHWTFLNRLVEALHCNVTVPLYGLAPHYSYLDAYRLLDQLYQNLLQEHEPEEIIFMGDSSGGGLVLGFAQTLRDRELPLPGGIVLLSPWLDIRLRNPDIKRVEPHDPVLAVPGNQQAGRMWAAGDDMDLPELSPITGSLQDLPPICALIGTDDILLPDVRLLRDKARAQDRPIRYCEFESMFHIWMLSAIPEAKRALDDIVTFIRDLPTLRQKQF